MARKSERLNRLVIPSPCAESWEAMSAEAGGGGRHCPRCRKHVHDLAAMEAREIEALVAATGGRFCARITRDRSGDLVTRRPPLPPAPAPDLRRASPVAAAVVGALVGLSGAAWAGAPGPIEWSGAERPPAPAPERPGAPPESPSAKPRPERAAGAVLAGWTVDREGLPLPGVTVVARDAELRERLAVTGADGAFAFAGLPAGTYSLEARLEGFEFPVHPNVTLQPGGRRELALTGEVMIMGEITVGAIAVEERLLSAYRESHLVVIATVGHSLQLDGPDSSDHAVRTELQVTTVLKGRLRGSTVRIDRSADPDDPEALQPGETVLAFLTLPEDRATGPGEAAYVTVDGFDPRRLSADALRAYRGRIEALARLGEEPTAGELLEWLVATAEDEHTRKESVLDLQRAVDALEGLDEEWARRLARSDRTDGATVDLDAEAEAGRLLAQSGAPADEVEPEVLGALLTPRHRERLSRALLATDRFTEPDLYLFTLVRPWTGEAALRWLAERLADDAEPDWVARRAMEVLAEELADEGLQRLLAEADAEIEALLDAPEPQDETEEVAAERLEAQIGAIEERLHRTFLHALGGRP